jgi:hypothetical protein
MQLIANFCTENIKLQENCGFGLPRLYLNSPDTHIFVIISSVC